MISLKPYPLACFQICLYDLVFMVFCYFWVLNEYQRVSVSAQLFLVWNLKNWSRRSQNPFLGKFPILSYCFGSKSSSLFQIVCRSLGLDRFSGLGLENTHFTGLGLSLEYSWIRVSVSVSLVETASTCSVSVSVSNLKNWSHRSLVGDFSYYPKSLAALL